MGGGGGGRRVHGLTAGQKASGLRVGRCEMENALSGDPVV